MDDRVRNGKIERRTKFIAINPKRKDRFDIYFSDTQNWFYGD